MLQCYALMCGRSVTAFLAPPRSQHPGQGPRSPHPKAGPGYMPPPSGSECTREGCLRLQGRWLVRFIHVKRQMVVQGGRNGEKEMYINGTYCLHLQGTRWRQYDCQNHLQSSASSRGVITHQRKNNVVLNFLITKICTLS
jgi:hypothetical protein